MKHVSLDTVDVVELEITFTADEELNAAIDRAAKDRRNTLERERRRMQARIAATYLPTYCTCTPNRYGAMRR